MTDKHNTSLSSYQRAILYEMGISQWQLTEPPAVLQIEASVYQTEQPETSVPTVSPPEVVSIPQRVLLLMSANEANDSMVKDILLSLSLDKHEQVLASPEQLKNYSDYQLAWCINQEHQQNGIQWRDNCLITSSLNSFNNSEYKKQLWLALQKHHDNAVC
jgi:DNA polymerase III psi subunit